jgi:hypothetical protein
MTTVPTIDADFYIKRRDAREPLRCQLKDGLGAHPNLTGAVIRFHMRRQGGSLVKVDALAEVVDAVNGIVQYPVGGSAWPSADVDTAGIYEAEWQVSYSGNQPQTFPSDGYIIILITDDIA